MIRQAAGYDAPNNTELIQSEQAKTENNYSKSVEEMCTAIQD